MIFPSFNVQYVFKKTVFLILIRLLMFLTLNDCSFSELLEIFTELLKICQISWKSDSSLPCRKKKEL